MNSNSICRCSTKYLYLVVFTMVINCRYYIFRDYIDGIQRKEPGGMDGFTKSYETFGIHVKPDGSVTWREWCPRATELRVFGDFSKCSWYILYYT